MADHSQRYYDALKRITQYQSVAQLQRTAERQYGLDSSEALEMAYENILEEAKAAIHGRRRPAERAAGSSGPEAGGGR